MGTSYQRYCMKTVTSGWGSSHVWMVVEKAVNLRNMASCLVVSSYIVHTTLHMQSFFAKTFFGGQCDRRLEVNLTKGLKPPRRPDTREAPGQRVYLTAAWSTTKRSVADGTVDVQRRVIEKNFSNITTRTEVFQSCREKVFHHVHCS